MIHCGDKLKQAITGTIFEVTATYPGSIAIQRDSDGFHHLTLHADRRTGDMEDSKIWSLHDCPHAVTELPHTPYTSRLIEYLAYNNGVMESRLEDMWLTLDRINSRLVANSMFRLQQDVARLLGGIQTTAESLHPFPQPDGSARTSRLFDMIYADRK